MAEGQIRFIIFYLAFFLTIAYIGGLIPSTGLGVTGGVVGVLPELDQGNLTIISYLIFGFEWAIYFLGLQGLTLAGIPTAYAAILGIVFDVVLVYIVVRLVRGGG